MKKFQQNTQHNRINFVNIDKQNIFGLLYGIKNEMTVWDNLNEPPLHLKMGFAY